MLDALRHNKEVSQGPDLTSHRTRPDDAVLASLGYSTGRSGSDEPPRGPQILRIVIGTVVVAVAALLLWQIGASYGLLPNPPWRAAKGAGSASAGGPAVQTDTRRDARAEAPRRQEPALPAAKIPVSSVATQAETRSAKPPAVSAEKPSVPSAQGHRVDSRSPVEVPKPAAAIAPATAASRPASGGAGTTVREARPETVTKAVSVQPSPKAEAPAPVPPAARGQVAARSTEKPAAPGNQASPAGGAAQKTSSPIYRTPSGETDHFRLALYYQRTGDFENALVQYRGVLEANELNPEAHNNLGLLYQDKALYEEAIREFRRATFIDPKYMTAHNNLGVALLKSGKVDAAITEFKWIATAEPRNIEALTNLALALKTNGRSEEARETLQRVLDIDSKYPAAHYNLALILEEGGDLARAVEHYEKFLVSAGAEYASLSGEVRARIQVLKTKIGQ